MMIRRACLAVAVLAIVVTGCGGSSKDKAAPAASTTTTGGVTSSTTETTTTPGSGGTAGETSVWDTDAQTYRGKNGTTYTLDCTANGTESAVWGAGTYTDDSSICNAAVQVGLITFADGGSVTYEIAAGEDSYEDGNANGVISQSYEKWGGSFTFPDAAEAKVPASAASWSRSVSGNASPDGTRVTRRCAANGTAAAVWGSDPYTEDSSVCTAAVHSGLITLAAGGTVVVELAPGENSYTGTTANGVTTQSYGQYGGSFTSPSDQPSG